MARYRVRFVHRIAPKDSDVSVAELPDGSFSDRKTLGAALRKAGMLASGKRILSFRTETGGKVVAFPSYGIWHALVLEAE